MKEEQNFNAEAALSYARRGWRVFPVHSVQNGRCDCGKVDCDNPGKHPRTVHGVKDATTDEKLIREWWTRWRQANVGIATGAASGLDILDVDPRHGGDESLARLEREWGKLPATVESLTGGGGRHILFRHPGFPVPNKVGIEPGLDIRGDGGYIIAPPSLHVSGRRYEWEVSSHPNEVPLAELPRWLLDEITGRPDRNGNTPRLDTAAILAGVPDGQRDEKLFRLACKLRRADVPRDMTEKLILEAARNCTPPFPDQKALEKVSSAYTRYESGDGAAERQECKEDAVPQPVPTFARPLSELMAGQDIAVDYIAEPILERGTIGFVGGEPKLCKSWYGLHMALCVATVTPVLGKYPVPRKERVLYVQEEDGPDLVRRRIRLLCKGHEIPLPEDAYFRIAVRTGFRVDDPRWYQALCKELAEFRPTLVIVDVFNKIHAADENEQRGMTMVMRLFEKARREFGCGFLLVHHFKKQSKEGSKRGNQRLRGSSVLGGWSECSFYLNSMEGGAIRVEHESKMTSLDPFAFRLEDQKDAQGKVVGVRLVHLGDAGVVQQSDKLQEILLVVTTAFSEGSAEACTVKALAERADIVPNTARAYLKLLEEAGKVREEQVRPGDKGRKVAAYVPAQAGKIPQGDEASTQPPRGGDLLRSPEEKAVPDNSTQNQQFALSSPSESSTQQPPPLGGGAALSSEPTEAPPSPDEDDLDRCHRCPEQTWRITPEGVPFCREHLPEEVRP